MGPARTLCQDFRLAWHLPHAPTWRPRGVAFAAADADGRRGPSRRWGAGRQPTPPPPLPPPPLPPRRRWRSPRRPSASLPPLSNRLHAHTAGLPPRHGGPHARTSLRPPRPATSIATPHVAKHRGGPGGPIFSPLPSLGAVRGPAHTPPPHPTCGRHMRAPSSFCGAGVIPGRCLVQKGMRIGLARGGGGGGEG